MRGSGIGVFFLGLAWLVAVSGCRWVLPISDVGETAPPCGNGALDPEEECDPGKLADPGCDGDCRVVEGWSCEGEPSVCAPVCGDGLVVAEGECEGQDPGEATCENTGHGVGSISCSADCRLDFSACILVREVGCGADHSCARLSSGYVACWGANARGQLGDGTTSERLTAVFAQDLKQVTSLALGDAFTCALFGEGEPGSGGVACWGDNRLGQLGQGTESPGQVNIPSELPWFDGSQVPGTIAAHAGHVCAAVYPGGDPAEGAAACWGANGAGQADAGSPGADVREPWPQDGLTGVVSVCAGLDHSCAVLDASTGDNLVCWGANDRGQLGDGTTEPRDVPVTVPGRYRSVSCGGSFTCAVTEAGAVACWGADDDGRLGTGGAGDSSTPAELALPGEAVQVSCGLAHACARLGDGTLACWGRNWDGQVGDGSNTQRSAPVPVTGLAVVDFVSAGHQHTCAAAGGTAWCWGANDAGQLGDGTHRPGSSTPKPVLF